MGKKNRERRAAKKRERGRSEAHETARGPGQQARTPPMTPSAVAEHATAFAHDHAHGDRAALPAGVQLLLIHPTPADTVDRGLEVALRLDVEELWANGWLPLDVVEHAWRILRADLEDLLADVVAAQTSQYAAAS